MKVFTAIISLVLLTGTWGCSKQSEGKPEEVFTKFPRPQLKVDETGKYYYSMTALITIPAELHAGMQDDDQLAAFINDECTGEGVNVKMSTGNAFFILIRGMAD